MTLFDSGSLPSSFYNLGDFYKNDFYNIIREKFDQKFNEIHEKLNYNEQQKDQIQMILDAKNRELTYYMSE